MSSSRTLFFSRHDDGVAKTSKLGYWVNANKARVNNDLYSTERFKFVLLSFGFFVKAVKGPDGIDYFIPNEVWRHIVSLLSFPVLKVNSHTHRGRMQRFVPPRFLNS